MLRPYPEVWTGLNRGVSQNERSLLALIESWRVVLHYWVSPLADNHAAEDWVACVAVFTWEIMVTPVRGIPAIARAKYFAK